MKKTILNKLAKCGALACAAILACSVNTGIVSVGADESENLLYESDWKMLPQEGTIEFKGTTASFTPLNVQGATYVDPMGDGKISFNYKVEYPEDLLSDGDAPFKAENAGGYYKAFFGVMFMNTPEGVSTANANISLPYSTTGGFPYMVAFDYEPQVSKAENETQWSQLGLTLRRYKFNGSHDFTKWSTVNPTDATYYNNTGLPYESKVPAYSKPVTVDTAFDGNAHTVEIETKSLYKSNGDDCDAIKIDVTFDGELCLTVVDEMPFTSDYLGMDWPMDKRGQEGFVSIYCYNGDDTFDNYTLKMNWFSLEPANNTGSNGSGSTANDSSSDDGEEKSGCGSVVSIGSVAATVALLGVAFLANKKKEG